MTSTNSYGPVCLFWQAGTVSGIARFNDTAEAAEATDNLLRAIPRATIERLA